MTFGAWIGLVIGVAYVCLLAAFLAGLGWASRSERLRAQERDEWLRDALAEAERESLERES